MKPSLISIILFLKFMIEFLKGKKTYIVCALTIIYAITGMVLGKLAVVDGSQMIELALIASGLRSGMNK